MNIILAHFVYGWFYAAIIIDFEWIDYVKLILFKCDLCLDKEKLFNKFGSVELEFCEVRLP